MNHGGTVALGYTDFLRDALCSLCLCGYFLFILNLLNGEAKTKEYAIVNSYL
jgi:hypothetical protein